MAAMRVKVPEITADVDPEKRSALRPFDVVLSLSLSFNYENHSTTPDATSLPKPYKKMEKSIELHSSPFLNGSF
jgi:hypothetical protein